MTGGTYFTGGNGVGIAFEACGIRDVFGVEYDDKIAQVARDNGFPVTTADVRDIDPASLPRVDWFHASPVCKNASTAKADGEESPEDLETAQAVERYIDHHKPRIFSLENVWGYREFQAFQDILKCLTRNGYAFDYWHLNSADYGVPQTRKRLILVARNDGIKPRKPLPTHTENPTPFFDDRKKWIGWYEAIEDLIPTLPPSQFVKWQLKRLPQEIKTMLFANGGFDGGIWGKGYHLKDEPTMTISTQQTPRAFLTNLDNASREFTVRQEDEPYPTLTASAMRRDVSTPKAYITAGGDAWSPVLDDTAPLFTLSSSKAEHATRAYLVNESSTMEVRGDAEPATTQIANGRNGGIGQRAFILADRNTTSSKPVDADSPAFTLMAGHASHNRGYLGGGRVVKMTPRALARFQSFPDTYTLPEKASLACTIIGNAVPPLLMQRVIEAQND